MVIDERGENIDIICEETFRLFCDVFAPMVKREGRMEMFLELVRLSLHHHAYKRDETNERVH